MSPEQHNDERRQTERGRLRGESSRAIWQASLCVLTGALWLTLCMQSLLSVQSWSATFVSPPTWQQIIERFGGQATRQLDGTAIANVSFFALFMPIFGISLLTWIVGGWLISLRAGHNQQPENRARFRNSLSSWGWNGWRWLWIAGLWESLRIAMFIIGWRGGSDFLIATPQFFLAFMCAGWLTEFFTLLGLPRERSASAISAESLDYDRLSARLWNMLAGFPRGVWFAVALYVVVFTIMNWQLFFGLWIPHGDSAMYEEHLWNLLHGKGFRSYLDQGLFLGEHIQVIHLLLIPLYVIWPSHLLLELCQSVILALGAFPTFHIAYRHTSSRRAATCLAWAYLLYFPLQFLDIAIDLKTFRPNSLAVPILLVAIDQFERRKFRNVWIGVLLALSAQEDFSIILACWGLWMVVFPRANQPERDDVDRSTAPTTSERVTPSVSEIKSEVASVRKQGIALFLFNVVYLFVVLRVVIPWFRGGVEIHYSSYFSKFGKTIPEIASNIIFHPWQTLTIVVNGNFFLYALALLMPLGFLPLKSWKRLLVVFPLFVTLCLNEVAANPRHHFHAPVIPFLIWAAAVGLGRISKNNKQNATQQQQCAKSPEHAEQRRLWVANWLWTSGLATSLFFSLSPLGIAFWDPGSLWHWRHLYITGMRAEKFPLVYELIPLDSRVASTDFIHPRFTHHERSYDYSHYKRMVSGYELTVPDDTDYIVIDTMHHYSEIKIPEQVREYREHPERWELVPDRTDGYYIVLKRMHPTSNE